MYHRKPLWLSYQIVMTSSSLFYYYVNLYCIIRIGVINVKGLYVHIPFCGAICHYCDFVKRVPKNDQMVEDYIDVLVTEIASYQSHFDTIDTIYIGGGTPSLLTPVQLEKLLSSLSNIHPIEFTIEVNPESYTKEKGLIMRKYGVNRVSIGVQTFNEKLLAYINRKHTNKDVFNTIRHLKTIGIPYLSIDLIYAIPGQTMDDLAYDLQQINKLNIHHVSLYSLILEDKTYFYHQFVHGKFHPASQDLEADMYGYIMEELTKQGFMQYEISNYAKHGETSKHNIIYWSLDEYIGVGLGAHGFIDGYRTYNERSLPKYINHFQKEKIFQTDDMLLQDALIFGLRKLEGVHIEKIEKRYNIRLFERYPHLKSRLDDGLITIEHGYLKLTTKGLFLGNQVFMEFME